MAKRIPEEESAAILAVVESHPGGASRADIAAALPWKLAPRTLQFRLKSLVDAGRLVTEGEVRAVKYRLPHGSAVLDSTSPKSAAEEAAVVPISKAGEAIRRYVARPPAAPKPAGYQREFLDSYEPNAKFYLSLKERGRLAEIGRSNFATEAAGTYARQVLNRLLIDLSWNSSRLEGNTYSLLDTKRLIEFGQEAGGRDRREAQMIVNHKTRSSFSSVKRRKSASTATRSSTCTASSPITCCRTRGRRDG